jgi:serine/threonine protein kinase
VDTDGHACLADFGVAPVIDDTHGPMLFNGGSVPWMAPELLAPELFDIDDNVSPYSWASDVYAFAMTCVEVIIQIDLQLFPNADILFRLIL